MDKEIRVKGILSEIEGVRRNYHINYYIEDEFGWDDLYCILDYINALQQERNNYKELYEKENKNWNELRKYLEDCYDYSDCIKINNVLKKIEDLERL